MSLFDFTRQPFKVDRPIRVISAFAGIGSVEMALRDLGAKFEHYRVYENDPYAVKDYNNVHGTSFEPTDICDVKGGDLGICDKDRYVYLLSYTYPCAPAGSLVKTDDVYKPIEDIKVGDLVYTHENRTRRVVKTMSRKANHINLIKANGVSDLYLTDNHPLYCMRGGEKCWIKAKDLVKGDRVSFNVPQGNSNHVVSPEILWMLGRYCADGHINKYSHFSVEFSIGLKKVDEFIAHTPQEFVGRFKTYDKPSILSFRIADEDFWSTCHEFGRGAGNKEIPQWVIDLPVNLLRHFLDGYLSGDGHVRVIGNTTQVMFSTISHKLFLGLQQIIAKCEGQICSGYVRHDKRGFQDSWCGQYYKNPTKTSQITDGNQIFTEVRSVERIDGKIQVYNLEVEGDNSYTINNIIVHNCQDISLAGKRAGMAEGSGTRSSLLWEIKRLLNETDELPQILLMENVKAAIGEGNLKDFKEWSSFLESKGYSNYMQVMQTADYGVPQSRERVIMISLLGEYVYHFPEEMELRECMADRMENEVHEKYYINTEKARQLIEELIAKGELPPENFPQPL